MGRPFTSTDRSRLARQRVSEGVSDPVQLADELGFSVRQANRYINERDGRRTPVPVPWTPELRAQALAMLEDRAGYSEVARTLGMDPKRIAKAFPGYALTLDESIERAITARTYQQYL